MYLCLCLKKPWVLLLALIPQRTQRIKQKERETVWKKEMILIDWYSSINSFVGWLTFPDPSLFLRSGCPLLFYFAWIVLFVLKYPSFSLIKNKNWISQFVRTTIDFPIYVFNGDLLGFLESLQSLIKLIRSWGKWKKDTIR